MNKIKTYFVTGLVVLLPLVLTLLIATMVINMLTKPFMGTVLTAMKYYSITLPQIPIIDSEAVLRLFCQAIILLSFAALVILFGIGMQIFVFNRIVDLWDWIIERIPLVGKIYTACREVIKSLFSPSRPNFGQVVLVPFPHRNMWSIGLITNESQFEKTERESEELVSVFVPTTPNPLMGFVLMFPRKEIKLTDLPAEKALKGVISCGLMLPHFNIYERSAK